MKAYESLVDAMQHERIVSCCVPLWIWDFCMLCLFMLYSALRFK